MAFLPHSIRDSDGIKLAPMFPVNESTKDRAPLKADGLYVTMIDMDKFIRINGLENSECTNPVFIGTGSTFTPDGVLSNEIFGTSSQDRRNRFGWIDLKTHYMNPLVAIKLSSYDRTMADCLYSRGRYSLSKEGKLISDPEGKTGPEFLYQIWNKLKPISKSTETTKEVAKFYSKPRDELFMTKWPVIPAFYRDINLSESTSSKSSNILNSKYSSLISYTQSLALYADGFGTMTYLTQARVQSILTEIYQELMIHTVKGNPAKFGMLRRTLAGKNLPYTVRLVITAPNLNQESLDRVQVRFGHATIPLHYICAMFMPFMVHELKSFFDAEFIRSGTVEVMDGDKIRTTQFQSSYDENEITGMINKYVNSPGSRFDPVMTPPDLEGNRHHMIIAGRFNKDNTTFKRPATYTDILYITALRVCRDKHVWLTRYPLDNPAGQWCGRIIVSSTIKTTPCTIGNDFYEFYPVIEDGVDPLNAFMTTAQMPNTMIGPMGADFMETPSESAVW